MVWIGGMVIIPFLATPLVRRTAGSEAVAALVRSFQRLSRELILVVLLTGIFNLLIIGAMSNFQFSADYLALIGAKLSLFLVIVANQLWYSYRLVPRVLESSRMATWSAVANVFFGGLVIYLGLSLRGV